MFFLPLSPFGVDIGGLECLTPQHLKDLVCSCIGEAGVGCFKELTALVSLMLSGNEDETINVSYESKLCVLSENDGDIRPIAVANYGTSNPK